MIRQVQGGTAWTVFTCTECGKEFRSAFEAPLAVPQDQPRRFCQAMENVRIERERLQREHRCGVEGV